MKICLAQTAPIKGDIKANIAAHLRFIALAVYNKADFILFPELSLTGYEPALAKDLATTPDDKRFGAFQKMADEKALVIGIGVPLKKEEGTTISLLLFQPSKRVMVYSKQYLHPDEEPFFVCGQNNTVLLDKKEKTALAICYELSVSEHAETAFRQGARIYLASVAKTPDGVSKACERLSQMAKQYAITALMVNCLGINDGVLCGGRSSAWNGKGELLHQLDDEQESILLLNTATGEAWQQRF